MGKFLDLCHKKLVLKKSNASDRCGFFRINGESVVPYTVKEGTKYVPLFYFEGETEHLKLKSEVVDGWDLAYLKFCCKVQGIRNELFANDVCKVVALEEIKGHFPSGTTFEVLRTEGKCGVYDPVPLVLVKDIMTYMPQMKYMFSNMMAGTEPAGKRQRVA